MPSPIHRDPEIDGDDYGCLGTFKDEANASLARMVGEIEEGLREGAYADGGAVIVHVRRQMTDLANHYRSRGDASGICDTIVKENVRDALVGPCEMAGLEVDWMGIYGW